MTHYCPICKTELILSKIQSFHMYNSLKCPVEYNSDITSTHFILYVDKITDEFVYCTFYTNNFYAYWYKKYFDNRENIALIYHNQFPKGEIIQYPFVKIDALTIDFNNLDKFDEKWRKLSLFI